MGKLRIDRFCHLVWFWMTDGASPEDIAKVEQQLWIPPVGEEAAGPWSAEAEMAAFSQLQEALGR